MVAEARLAVAVDFQDVPTVIQPPTLQPKDELCCGRCEQRAKSWARDEVYGGEHGYRYEAIYVCGGCGRKGTVRWQDESRTWSYQDIYWQYRIDCCMQPAA